MKYSLFLIFFWAGISFGQQLEIPASFDHLQRKVIDEEWNILAFVPKESIIDLPDIKLLEEDDFVELVTPVAVLDLEGNGIKNFLILFSPGPSMDPYFMFYKISNTDTQFVFGLGCKQVIVPGNGYIFTSGHANNMFNTRIIYKYENNTVAEIAQPYNYVGLKTKTKKDITIYEDINFTQKLAVVPNESPVEILLGKWNEEEDTWKFLIKASIGFVGWWKLDDNYHSEEIEGIFFAGD